MNRRNRWSRLSTGQTRAFFDPHQDEAVVLRSAKDFTDHAVMFGLPRLNKCVFTSGLPPRSTMLAGGRRVDSVIVHSAIAGGFLGAFISMIIGSIFPFLAGLLSPIVAYTWSNLRSSRGLRFNLLRGQEFACLDGSPTLGTFGVIGPEAVSAPCSWNGGCLVISRTFVDVLKESPSAWLLIERRLDQEVELIKIRSQIRKGESNAHEVEGTPIAASVKQRLKELRDRLATVEEEQAELKQEMHYQLQARAIAEGESQLAEAQDAAQRWLDGSDPDE